MVVSMKCWKTSSSQAWKIWRYLDHLYLGSSSSILIQKHIGSVRWIDALLQLCNSSWLWTRDHGNFDRILERNGLPHGWKDILRFHLIYWPILLMMLDIKLPERLIAHGWFVMKDGKMSKSKGNVIYPEMLVERFGLDPLRYYLMAVCQLVQMVPSPQKTMWLASTMNWPMTLKPPQPDGSHDQQILWWSVPAYVENVTAFDADLAKVVEENIAEYHKQMNAVDYPRALEAVWNIISRTNKYSMREAPGSSPKKMVTRNNWQRSWLTQAASLRVVAHLIQPFMMKRRTKTT